MPQPKYKISDFLLSCLKFELESKISFRIFTKLDCKKTSELIQKSCEKTISESTIYRLFLWGENKNSPYLHTLDIIAQFVGYKNWFELEKHFNEIKEFKHLYGVFPDQQQYKSLLSINIHHGGLKPLYNFLEQFPSDLSQEKKIIFGEDIYLSLKSNPNKNLEFYKQFHSLPIVREGFFEYLADPDFSIPDYEIGLGYYLKNIKPHQSIKSLQDYIFANSLLLRYNFLKGNKDSVKQLGKELYVNLQLTEKDMKEIFIFPKMRYFSYRLFYDESINVFNKNYFEWLLDYTYREIQNSTMMESRIIIHTLCDTLQIYPKLQEEIYYQFVLKCPKIFMKFPSYIHKLSIKERLRFVDPNGATFYVT
jgi:hypothetical protein